MFESAEPLWGQPDWFRVVLASIGDAVIVTDAQGRVSLMNPVAESLTGWSQADAAGKPLAAVFPSVNGQTLQPLEDPVAEVHARGVVVGLADHTVVPARDGPARPVDGSRAPIRDRDGRIIGIVLAFRDISERPWTERAAADARADAEGIVATVRECLLVLDATMCVKVANRSYYDTFRVSPAETTGRFLYDLGNGQWNIPRLRALLDEVLPHNQPFSDFEMDHEFENIGRRTMLLNARRVLREGSQTELILLAIEDVTERRRAAHALVVSETRYRRLFEAAQDGILIIDADRRQIIDANPFLTTILGYALDELVGKELWEIGLFKDIEASKAAFRELQDKAYIRYDDLPLETKGGRHIAVEFVSNIYAVDGKRIIQCNIRDITARRRAEDALREAHDQLSRRVAERTAELAAANDALKAEIAAHEHAEAARRELLQQLVTAQEEERHHIARELHDQMGQHLTALILGLKVVKDATPASSPLYARMHQLRQLADLIGKEIHHLALELRPTALDDLGLHTTLLNYIEQWSERSGVEVDFHSTGLDRERLPPPLETALYRLVQEGLTNVLKHAQARRVSLILQRSSNLVLVILEDDGRGFDVEALINSPGTAGRLGLLGMRERVALVGGTLTLESSPGRGTAIFVRIPLPADGGGGSDA